ncbi:MAG: TIGR03086 family metal-binding protein, partial [Sciscionella sp.]
AVHGWDLACAIGADDEIDDSLAVALIEEFEPKISGWQGAGIFAAPLDPPAGASNETRLLALLGRDRSWRPG